MGPSSGTTTTDAGAAARPVDDLLPRQKPHAGGDAERIVVPQPHRHLRREAIDQQELALHLHDVAGAVVAAGDGRAGKDDAARQPDSLEPDTPTQAEDEQQQTGGSHLLHPTGAIADSLERSAPPTR